MSFKETVARWFSQGMPDNFDAGATPEEPSVPTETQPKAPESGAPSGSPASPGAEASAAEENRRLKAENEQLKAAQATRIEEEAKAFADGLVAASKIMPYEATLVARLHADLARLDAERPYPAEGIGTEAVAGKDGQPGFVHSRAEGLKGVFAMRPAHTFTRERIVVPAKVEQDGFTIVGNGSAGRDEEGSAYELGRKYAERANGARR